MKTIETSITDSQGVVSVQVQIPHHGRGDYGVRAAPIRDYAAAGLILFFTIYAACLSAKWTYDKFIKPNPPKK